MDKIAIVNKKDKVIGTEERDVALKKGLIHRIARIILINSKGQIYLQKRGANKVRWPNRWDQSAGGHVDGGEEYYEAALREAREELGIESLTLEPVIKFFQNEVDGSVNLKRFNMLYEARHDGRISLTKGETSGGGWFDVNKIRKWIKEKPDDFTPGCRDTLKMYWKIKKNN